MTFIESKQVRLKSVLGSENYTLQELQDLNNSAGVISGGGFADNGNGTIKIAAGVGQLRDANTIPATLYHFTWPEIPSLSLTDNSNNWIYFRWNSGNPTITVNPAQPTDRNTNIILGNIYREGTTLHINRYTAVIIGDHASKTDRFNKDIMPYAHVSGALLTNKGQRKFAISDGIFWEGLTRFTTGAVDTSTTGSFRYWYHDNSGNWVSTLGNTQIDNTQHDTLTGRVSLSPGYYTNAWIFLSTNATDVPKVVYDIDEYATEDLANGAILPPLPPPVEAYCFIIGRAILKEGQSEFISLKNIFSLSTNTINSLVHNNLNGLQGGSPGEFYHLSADQYNNLASAIDSGVNANTAGFGVFLDEISTTLRFKGINVGSNKLSILDNNTTKSIDLDINENNLSLNNISGTLSVSKGGTGATSAPSALTNLGAVAKAGDTMSGFLTLNADPTNALHAVTKQYVDSVVSGLDVKQSVRVASTTNINISSPGSSIDSVVLVSGDRVLLKDQSTASQNGIYVFNGAATPLTRATDADQNAEVTAGLFTFVEEGTVNADSGWVLTTNTPITVGTTALTFTQFTGAGQITAGLGLTKTGNTLDVGSGQGIQVNADDVTVRLNSNSGLVKNLGTGSNELGVNLNPTNPGLVITSNILDTKLKSDGGLTTDTNGLFLNLSGNAISGTLSISNGGTGQTTALSAFNALSPLTTQGDLLYFDGTNNIRLPKNTSTTRYLSNTGVNNNPVWSQIDLTNGVVNTLPTTNGGTGQSTYTDGQLLIGNTTGGTLTKSTLTAGQNINIVNGSGSITVGSTELADITTDVTTTTNNTATTIKTVSTTTNTVIYIEVYANGRRTGGTSGTVGDSASFKRSARIKNVGGTVSVQNTQSDYTSRDQNGWNLTFTVSGTNILVQVTGANNNNVSWTAVTKTLVT